MPEVNYLPNFYEFEDFLLQSLHDLCQNLKFYFTLRKTPPPSPPRNGRGGSLRPLPLPSQGRGTGG